MLRMAVKRLTSVADDVSAGLTAASVGRLSAHQLTVTVVRFRAGCLGPVTCGTGHERLVAKGC
jgi:hypothetical protein